MLQNILNLRNSFFTGHYNKNNITFKGDFNQSLIEIVQSTLEEADIPFKITVVDNHWKATKSLQGGVFCGLGSNLKFEYHIETATVALKKNTLDLFYLDPILKRSNPLYQKAVIAHEVTHILNLHTLQQFFMRAYFLYIKKVDITVYEKCEGILSAIAEYQADLGPLENLEGSEAQKYRFELF